VEAISGNSEHKGRDPLDHHEAGHAECGRDGEQALGERLRRKINENAAARKQRGDDCRFSRRAAI